MKKKLKGWDPICHVLASLAANPHPHPPPLKAPSSSATAILFSSPDTMGKAMGRAFLSGMNHKLVPPSESEEKITRGFSRPYETYWERKERLLDNKHFKDISEKFANDPAGDIFSPKSREAFLLMLCRKERTEELVPLLENTDITRFSSVDAVAHILKYLGRHPLESLAEKVLLDFKACDSSTVNTSDMIYSYVLGIPNFTVEDVISKFKLLHRKLEIAPSSVSYEKLIVYCCDSLKVNVALELVNEMIELGLTFSLETVHYILKANCENCDSNLVRQICSVISQGNLKPNRKTFKSMIDLCVKMKNYEGAYNMLSDLEKMNLMPTAAMYNAIMAAYFQEKNMSRGLDVFQEMEEGNGKPDGQTFSLLEINN